MFAPVGFLTILLGLVCLWLGYRATIATFIVTMMFGAAAVVIIGGANIQPAHFFIIFVVIAALTKRREMAAAIRAVKPFEPGFWLLCLTVLGAASAFLMPRVMAGSTDIIPLGTSQYADTGSTVPLGPVSSNLTQSVYMLADLLCFCLVAAVASSRAGFHAVLAGLIAFCVGNTLMALLDVGTFSAGAQWLLEPIRNTRYTLHHEEEVFGFKRIVGSYPEASAFARVTLGVLSFSATLWLSGYRPAWTGLLAIASLMLVVFSTSSAGLAGVVVVSALLYATAFKRCGVSLAARRSSAVVLFAPLIFIVAVLAVMLSPSMSGSVLRYVDVVILSKASTDSGIERASWNTVGVQNFIDSWGLGVGLGTVRTSSFAVALLANVGVWGTLLYAMFAASSFLKNRGIRGSLESDVRLAARNGCLALLVGDLLIASTVDQGLYFYALAAITVAYPDRQNAAPHSTLPEKLRMEAPLGGTA